SSLYFPGCDLNRSDTPEEATYRWKPSRNSGWYAGLTLSGRDEKNGQVRASLSVLWLLRTGPYSSTTIGIAGGTRELIQRLATCRESGIASAMRVCVSSTNCGTHIAATPKIKLARRRGGLFASHFVRAMARS